MAEGEPGAAGPTCPFTYLTVAEPNTTKDVDLKATFLEQLEVESFAQKSKFCLLEAAGLGDKIAAEVASRHAAKQEKYDAAGDTPPEPELLDCVFVVTGCTEDLLESAADGSKIDKFLYLHGNSVSFEEEEPAEDAEEGAEPTTLRKIAPAEVAAEVAMIHAKLQEAPFGDWKRDVKLETVNKCETLYVDGGVKRERCGLSCPCLLRYSEPPECVALALRPTYHTPADFFTTMRRHDSATLFPGTLSAVTCPISPNA
eukprot:g2259.t1